MESNDQSSSGAAPTSSSPSSSSSSAASTTGVGGTTGSTTGAGSSTGSSTNAVGATPSSTTSQPAGATAGTPLVKTDLSTGEDVTIPGDIASKFPQGASVRKHESGQLVANLPTDGGYHRVVAEPGQNIRQLADAVTAFTESQAK